MSSAIWCLWEDNRIKGEVKVENQNKCFKKSAV